MRKLTHLDIYEALYKAVALSQYAWHTWEKTNSEMMWLEQHRVWYLLRCLDAEHRPKGAQIVKRFKPLWDMVKTRYDKEDKEVAENHYSIPARKTRFTDRWGRTIRYDSALEARMARILSKLNIPFEPHVKFAGLYTPELVPFTYTVDFMFTDGPHKFIGISAILNGIEVKGCMESHDVVRIGAMKYFKELKIYIVTTTLIEFWERHYHVLEKETTQDGKAD